MDTTRSLVSVRAALDSANASDERDLDAAAADATTELRNVAAEVAAFANELDDGVGFFNSSTEFGRQLADQFDEVRRVSTVMGVVQALSLSEALFAAEMALLQAGARTGSGSGRRQLLTEADRNALERIRNTAADALVDASMPNDPEYDDDQD